MTARILYSALFLIPFTVEAQWINCSGSDVPGELVVQPLVEVQVGQSTPGVTYAVNPTGGDAPTHEFAITRMHVMASDMLGMELVGADADGIFNPEDFGIMEGQTFCLTPVSYDLEQLRTLLDSIFINNMTCCNILNLASEGFCDTLSNLGYTSGEDINDLNDVYRVMRLFDEDSTMSLEGFVFQITTVNNAGDILPGECGAQAFPFCYAVKFPFSQQCYSYGPPSSVREHTNISGLSAYAEGNSIHATFNAVSGGHVSLRIVSVDGRVIHTSERQVQPGTNRFAIAVPTNGIYHLSIVQGSERAVIKVAAF